MTIGSPAVITVPICHELGSTHYDSRYHS